MIGQTPKAYSVLMTVPLLTTTAVIPLLAIAVLEESTYGVLLSEKQTPRQGLARNAGPDRAHFSPDLTRVKGMDWLGDFSNFNLQSCSSNLLRCC